KEQRNSNSTKPVTRRLPNRFLRARKNPPAKVARQPSVKRSLAAARTKKKQSTTQLTLPHILFATNMPRAPGSIATQCPLGTTALPTMASNQSLKRKQSNKHLRRRVRRSNLVIRIL